MTTSIEHQSSDLFDATRYWGSEGSTGEYRPQPIEDEVPRLSGAGLDGFPWQGRCHTMSMFLVCKLVTSALSTPGNS